MKFIKKIWRRSKGFIIRWKYLILSLLLINFIIWYNCLPKSLFNDPTSTVLLDQDGNLLGATIADDEQWRFPYNPVVPEKFKKAIIQFEDRSFFSHWGISFRGLGRALYQNISGGKKQGASTITMQLMRMARKGQRRNIWQKFIEIYWASRAEWTFTKDEILALYASNAPMGGNVVGLDAASWRYFGRPADQLTWSESATLAVLPNAPSLMHPGKNREELIAKRNRLLDRLFKVEEIDSITWVLSKLEELPDKPHRIPHIAPHLLNRVIKDGHKGQIVHSTINLEIQEQVNSILSYHHEHLKENEIHNGAVLVMEVSTGNVLAYVGNVPDLEAEHSKDVDIISAPRSTGSILKPFLYAGMLENGEITPEMLIQDIPTVMSGYSPKNYNLKYEGVVPANVALAKSLNVPLVRMLTKFGVSKFHYLLNKLKFTTIKNNPNHYGLSLILGGAESNLWDLVSAYGMMSRCLSEYPNEPSNINRRANYLQGEDYIDTEPPIFNPATCWFTLEAMKELARPDDDINWEMFSTSQEIAWKTGTSFGFRDAWAVGTTKKYVVGVWVGNADGEGRPGLIGREAAAPILFDVFSSLPQSEWFDQPFDEMKKVEICKKTGFRASDACENKEFQWIPKSSLNTESCPFHQWVFLDETENHQVNSTCYNMSNAKKRPWFVLPVIAEYYYKNHDPNFKKLPSFDPSCLSASVKEELALIYPKNNSQIFVPTNFEEKQEKIIFEASHKNHNIILYWHLDDKYLGYTDGIHQIECIPEPGNHKLKIIDENGQSLEVKFEVLLRK